MLFRSDPRSASPDQGQISKRGVKHVQAAETSIRVISAPCSSPEKTRLVAMLWRPGGHTQSSPVQSAEAESTVAHSIHRNRLSARSKCLRIPRESCSIAKGTNTLQCESGLLSQRRWEVIDDAMLQEA